MQLFWRKKCSAWWHACVRTQHLKVGYYTPSPISSSGNKVMCHHLIPDTMQKHDVLQIITVLGNCKLEYSTREGICAENVIKHRDTYYMPEMFNDILSTTALPSWIIPPCSFPMPLLFVIHHVSALYEFQAKSS